MRKTITIENSHLRKISKHTMVKELLLKMVLFKTRIFIFII